MENRPLSVAAVVIALLAMTFSAGAAENGPEAAQAADWEARLVQADALQREGAARKNAADAKYQQQHKACFKAFRVYACQENANTERVSEVNEARRLMSEGKAQELQVKKEQGSDKALRREAEAPKRAAELEARELETQAERKAAAEAEAATRAAKAIKAEEGQKRRAADAERQAKKREEHEARNARQMEKAARRAAEAAKADK